MSFETVMKVGNVDVVQISEGRLPSNLTGDAECPVAEMSSCMMNDEVSVGCRAESSTSRQL